MFIRYIDAKVFSEFKRLSIQIVEFFAKLNQLTTVISFRRTQGNSTFIKKIDPVLCRTCSLPKSSSLVV